MLDINAVIKEQGIISRNLEKTIINYIRSIALDLIRKNTCCHGIDHNDRVYMFSDWVYTSLKLPFDKKIAIGITLEAYLHDIGRKHDLNGEGHAIRSAIMAEKIISSEFPKIDKLSVLSGIASHSGFGTKIYFSEEDYHNILININHDYKKADNPKILSQINSMYGNVLRDGDRFDLLRCPLKEKIDIKQLVYSFSKQFANTKEHKEIFKNIRYNCNVKICRERNEIVPEEKIILKYS